MDQSTLSSVAPRLSSLALIAALASPVPAAGQGADPAAPDVGIGSRVRFTQPGGRGILHPFGPQPLVGTITASDKDSITVLPKKGAAVQIPRTSSGSLQVSTGKQRRVLRGIVAGVALGLIAGGIVAGAEAAGGGYCICVSTEPSSSDDKAVRQAAIGGFALGALLGIAPKHDKWAQASLSQIPSFGSATSTDTPQVQRLQMFR